MSWVALKMLMGDRTKYFGIVFGVTEVAITAQVGPTSAAAYLGLWGIGSLAGGALATRYGTPGITTCLLALGATHTALMISPLLIVLSGATIAPTFAVVYGQTDRHAARATITRLRPLALAR